MESPPFIQEFNPVKGDQFYSVGLIKETTPQHLNYLLWGQIVLGLCFFIDAFILYVLTLYGINQCSFFSCVGAVGGVGGRCNETLIPGAECSHSESCQTLYNSSFYSCNWDTCMCQFTSPVNTGIQCITDIECGPSLNPCLRWVCIDRLCDEELAIRATYSSDEYWVCIAGLCKEEFVINATCSSDEQCVLTNGTGFTCNWDICSCVQQ